MKRGRPTQEKKQRRTIFIEQSLWDYAVIEAGRRTVRGGKVFSASEWVREALEEKRQRERERRGV